MSSQEINNGYMTYSLYSRERKEMILSTIQHDILHGQYENPLLHKQLGLCKTEKK